MKISTLRSKGFSIVACNGRITLVTHQKAFTVNEQPARRTKSGCDYEFIIRGWFDKDIPREVCLK